MKKLRRTPPPTAGAVARARRFDAIQRKRIRSNPALEAPKGTLCYDPSAGVLRGDSASPYVGIPVELGELFESSATVLVRSMDLPNGEMILPLCPDKSILESVVDSVSDFFLSQTPPSDPTEGCCVDERTGLITCPGGSDQWYMHGQAVPLTTMDCTDGEDGRICRINAGDNKFFLPSCPLPPPATPPLSSPPPELTGCCVDEDTGLITCPGGANQWYMHGRSVPLTTMSCTDRPDGSRWCAISTGDNRINLQACPKPPGLIPPPPPPPPEQECCYDVATGKLRCTPSGGVDGLSVSLLAMQTEEDGSIVAIVMSPQLEPNSTIVVPVCDDSVVDCCYDPTTQRIVCPGGALDGAAAGVVQAWVGPDGQIYVWAAWEGGGARMPLCPGTEECPPVFCCVNMNTLAYVCPGRPEINGTEAPVADIVVEDGFSWGILEDGSRVPMCGDRCPPPQLCPDCPTCPPGQWMSPDGQCTTPECPPGMIPPPPPQLPPPDTCCDECACDRPCASGCGGRRAGHGRRTNPSPRKQKIFAGNR